VTPSCNAARGRLSFVTGQSTANVHYWVAASRLELGHLSGPGLDNRRRPTAEMRRGSAPARESLVHRRPPPRRLGAPGSSCASSSTSAGRADEAMQTYRKARRLCGEEPSRPAPECGCRPLSPYYFAPGADGGAGSPVPAPAELFSAAADPDRGPGGRTGGGAVNNVPRASAVSDPRRSAGLVPPGCRTPRLPSWCGLRARMGPRGRGRTSRPRLAAPRTRSPAQQCATRDNQSAGEKLDRLVGAAAGGAAALTRVLTRPGRR
jgi:hypothetical protein